MCRTDPGARTAYAARQRVEHTEAKRGEHEMPTIALDCTVVHGEQDEGEEKGMPILVIRDIEDGGKGTGMMYAHVVPQKGVHVHAVKSLADAIGQLGHSDLIL